MTGSSTAKDLTAKCIPHNHYRAILRYGLAYVLRRIEEERRAREARRLAKAGKGPTTLCEPVAPWEARAIAEVA
jgi:hypothetical protein